MGGREREGEGIEEEKNNRVKFFDSCQVRSGTLGVCTYAYVYVCTKYFR